MSGSIEVGSVLLAWGVLLLSQRRSIQPWELTEDSRFRTWALAGFASCGGQLRRGWDECAGRQIGATLGTTLVNECDVWTSLKMKIAHVDKPRWIVEEM